MNVRCPCFARATRRLIGTVAVAATLGGVLAASACGGGASSPSGTPGSSPTPPTPPSPPSSPPAASAKPVLKGLVTQGPSPTATPPTNQFEELNAHPGVYSAAVIELYWSQLEPSQGVFDDSALVSALAGLTAYNAKYPATPVVGKLRIFMGVGTPAWVIAATGSVAISDSFGSGVVGEFWTAQYDALWQALQNHLAAGYDGNPLVGEVAITSCSSLTGEPFVLPQNLSDVANLHSAGYADALGMACLSNAAADYAAWKVTPLDFTFNAFTQIDTGVSGINTSFPIEVMTAFRAALGTRGVVANHGLQSPLAPGAMPIYAEFQTLYNDAVAAATISPLEFQTYSPTVDWTSAIALGLSYHPTEIEIWDTVAAGGSAPLTLAQLQGWAASLQ